MTISKCTRQTRKAYAASYPSGARQRKGKSGDADKNDDVKDRVEKGDGRMSWRRMADAGMNDAMRREKEKYPCTWTDGDLRYA